MNRKLVLVMGIANKYNKGSVFSFKIPKDFKYYSLHELYEEFGKDKQYQVNALYINRKSMFGDSPVLATNKFLVNLPQHLLETVNDMIADDELVEAVNNSKFGFIIYRYENKTNKTCYSVHWIDL